MLNADATKFTEMCKNFDKEEMSTVVKFIPSDILLTEIANRLAGAETTIKHIHCISNVIKEEMQYVK